MGPKPQIVKLNFSRRVKDDHLGHSCMIWVQSPIGFLSNAPRKESRAGEQGLPLPCHLASLMSPSFSEPSSSCVKGAEAPYSQVSRN